MLRSTLILAALIVAVPALSQTRHTTGVPTLPPHAGTESQAIVPRKAGSGTTFVVTTVADSGPGSLRQALSDARQSPGPHRIEFRIGGGGSYQEIFLDAALPFVSETLVIDGDTQGCADREVGPCVRVDGAGIEPSTQFYNAGFDVIAPDVEIRNLVLTRFFQGSETGGAAVGLFDVGAVVAGCRIGTDRTGLVTDPDGMPGTGDELGNVEGIGVVRFASLGLDPSVPLAALIGGDDPADANVIGGNDYDGIGIVADGVRVVGNYLGVGADGQTPLGNGFAGARVRGPSDENPTAGEGVEISSNVASGNGASGISLNDGPVGVTIAFNSVGTNADGLLAIPNGTPIPTGVPSQGTGIYLDAVDAQVLFNVVGGNTAFGIRVGFIDPAGEDPGTPITLSGNVISGNLVGIGSDLETPIPNGTAGNPNTGVGIALIGTGGRIVTGNTVEGNFSSGNTRAGLGGFGPAVYGNSFVGNFVGLTFSDERPLPNGGAEGVGIGFDQGAHDNVVGASSLDDAELGNVIGPHAAPIALLSTAGTGNQIGLNALVRPTASPLPAIDLGLDGPTPNDAGDADEGPNRLQNAPEILSTMDNGDGTLAVTVRVDSDPANAAYPLTVVLYRRQSMPGAELYAPVGVVEIPEASAGQPVVASVMADLDFPVERVSATATDADGNTSELPSAAVAVAEEGGVEAGRPVLAMDGPNPFGATTALRLTVDRAQTVRAEVFDTAGRRVAVLHDGPASPSEPLALAVDGAALAAGAYVVRVTGDGWQASRRVVLAR